jgi:hypothetical protein
MAMWARLLYRNNSDEEIMFYNIGHLVSKLSNCFSLSLMLLANKLGQKTANKVGQISLGASVMK